ncbi:MAG: methyltransferase [Cyclobacteriaceae bacterium]
MPNSFFQFKQFRINQERSGMKVTTDACLFGAYVANQIQKTNEEPRNILDIGCGTGLLTLMLAQITSKSGIDAIDMSESASTETQGNFEISPWNSRLSSKHSSLQHFDQSKRYDLIICNPPFFGKNQKGMVKQRNQAIHNDHLTMEELSEGIVRLLTKEGVAWIMYPEWEMKAFIKWMEKNSMSPGHVVLVRNKEKAAVFRMIVKFSYLQSAFTQRELLIRNNDGNYSHDFSELVKGYYL